MPFTLRECEELVRDSGLSMSRQEICSLYMIFGGVAYYWGFLRKGESVAQSVDRLLFSPNEKLRGEFDSMVASLFKKDIGYRKVFTALAAKGVGMTREELLNKTGLPDGRVFCQILDSLEKCGFMRRYAAFGKKRRDALYQLLDSFSLFHLRFIEPESNPDPNDWTIGISSKAKSAWEGLAFERVCAAHLGVSRTLLDLRFRELATGFLSRYSVAHISIRSRRFNNRAANVEMRNQRHRVVDDKILELKPHHRLPYCQVFSHKRKLTRPP